MSPSLIGQPIDQWMSLIHSADNQDALEGLRQIYRDNYPTQGELIFTGACEFECAHCIYPPDYAKANRSLPVEQWERIFQGLMTDLGIDTFVYGGRSVTQRGIKLLSRLRKLAPDARIGLIDNGISLLRFREQLAELRLDWIDISLDGLERDHDVQRGREGSFHQGLESALWLKEHAVAPKVNILTCLTTINRHSVIPMIREVNALGFKNFFITPVTVLDGYRPDPSLMVSGSEFSDFVKELEDAVPELDDAWVELNIFAVDYMQYIGENYSRLWNALTPQGDCLERKSSHNGNDFAVHYYPSSLTGVRELIMNTNGDVISPKVMAKGVIPQQDSAGSLLQKSALDIVRDIPASDVLDFYWKEFLDEKHSLRNLLEN